MSRNTMPAPKFFALVKEYFHYLFDEYGFVVKAEEITQHHDVCWMRLGKGDCDIEIGREDGYVFVHVGFASTPDTMFDLDTVETYLDGEAAVDGWAWSKAHVDYVTELLQGLQWYADRLRPYCDRIQDLFVESNRPRVQSELTAWGELLARRSLEALYQRRRRS
jgi:hypothetical protein